MITQAFKFEATQGFAANLDKEDLISSFRDKFFIPQHEGRDTIYFTGNSLGLQPKRTLEYIKQELDDWAKLGVEGHFMAKNPWLPYHENFPATLTAIIGCKEHELVVMNQLTVNLHLLMVTFYRPTAKRYKIICEAKAFPSDQYALESQVKFHGFDPGDAIIEVSPRAGEHIIRKEDILSVIRKENDKVALVMFGGVNYYTGQLFDIQQITTAAHEVGAYAGFDLAHAAGNVALHMHDWDVDFACWCSYKYLNSGPGGVAGVFIHERHASNADLPRFAGWWGYTKSTRFRMEKGFQAIPTAEGWQLSNAPVLSMAAHRAALEIFAEAGMDRLHTKRKLMSDYLLYIIDDINARLSGNPIEIITPRNPEDRGCQLSLIMKKNGKLIFDALTSQGVIADWREPDVIRIAPVPLYNKFEDIRQFGMILDGILSKLK